MKTIAENLQIIKDATVDIKQAIIDKGGNISGDISTWADAIRSIKSEDPIKVFYIIDIGEFQYEAGMTWGEFINSEYNNNNEFSFDGNGYIYRLGHALWYSYNGPTVHESETIAENFTYYRCPYGGAD
jgi:hypothetical protein